MQISLNQSCAFGNNWRKNYSINGQGVELRIKKSQFLPSMRPSVITNHFPHSVCLELKFVWILQKWWDFAEVLPACFLGFLGKPGNDFFIFQNFWFIGFWDKFLAETRLNFGPAYRLQKWSDLAEIHFSKFWLFGPGNKFWKIDRNKWINFQANLTIWRKG